jgi:hypothetical protein
MRIALFVLVGVIVGGVLVPAGLYQLATMDTPPNIRKSSRFEDAFCLCFGFIGLSGVAGGVVGGLVGRAMDRRSRRQVR